LPLREATPNMTLLNVYPRIKGRREYFSIMVYYWLGGKGVASPEFI